MSNEYPIEVFWSSEDRCWIADTPDLKFCSAHGATPVEAVKQVLLAQRAWLESARAHGDPVPRPRARLCQAVT